MTVAELFQWASIRRWGTDLTNRMEQALAGYLVVPSDFELCRIWGAIRAGRRSVEKPISPQDAWIAATAVRHALPLVTHNPLDFREIPGVEVRTVSP